MNRAIKKSRWRNLVFSCRQSHTAKQKNKGQALVEFVFAFILLLVIAWIPADWGLAFYTGQLALNASREGARIAAADPCLKGSASGPPCLIPNLADQIGSCTLGSCIQPAPDDHSVMSETARRLSMALLPGAEITVSLAGAACNQQVTVLVSGNYNFFFYRLLRLIAGNSAVPDNFVPIERSTTMRWEHQGGCPVV